MAELPDLLDRKRHVDLERSRLEPWLQRAGLALFVVVIAFGVANVFGQKVETASATSAVADLEVEVPNAARPGLLYEAQFTVRAHRALEKPALVLDGGWFDGFAINTVSPEPAEWTNRDGQSVLAFGPLEAGEELVLRFACQVHPTTIGRRSQDVVLENAGAPIVSVDRELTIFP